MSRLFLMLTFSVCGFSQYNDQAFEALKPYFPTQVRSFRDIYGLKMAPAMEQILSTESGDRLHAAAIGMSFLRFMYEGDAQFVLGLLDQNVLDRSASQCCATVTAVAFIDDLDRRFAQHSEMLRAFIEQDLVAFEEVEIHQYDPMQAQFGRIYGQKALSDPFFTSKMFMIRIKMRINSQAEYEIKEVLVRKTADGYRIAG